MQCLLCHYNPIFLKTVMKNSQNHLKNALVQLKVSVHELDLVRNDLVDHVEELDEIKENIQNSIQLIKESLKT